MGAECAQCSRPNHEEQNQPKDSIIIVKTPSETFQNSPKKQKPQNNNDEVSNLSLQSSILSAMSNYQNKINFHFKIINQERKEEVIKMNLAGDSQGNKPQKKYWSSNKESKNYLIQTAYCYFRDEEKQVKHGDCIEYSIYTNKDKQISSLLIFAGKYQQNKKHKGLELSLKWLNRQRAQIILLKGTYLPNGDFFGMKKLIREGEYENYWGTFNSQLQMQGQGVSDVSEKNSQQKYEYYRHKGLYQSGKKHGEGILNVYVQDSNYFHPRNDTHSIKYDLFKSLKEQVQTNNIKTSFPQELQDLIQIVSKYPARIRQIDGRIIERIRYTSEWCQDKMKGFTIEESMGSNFRYQGQYDNNKRNGYGQQFQDDDKLAKGFYLDNQMQYQNEHRLLYKGFTLVDNRWSREVEKK